MFALGLCCHIPSVKIFKGALLIAAALGMALSPASCQPQHVRCSSSSTEPGQLILAAEKHLGAGELNVAIVCAQEVVRAAKTSPTGYELTAKVCIFGGDFGCCAQFCRRAWELRGGESSGVENSRTHPSTVTCSSAGDLEALLLCGNCYASQESWVHALQRYRAATACAHITSPLAASTSISESLANAYNNLGNVLRLQHEDRVDEAVGAYLGAGEWMPQLDDAWFNAGSLVAVRCFVKASTHCALPRLQPTAT
jgi:hypothetical protein